MIILTYLVTFNGILAFFSLTFNWVLLPIKSYWLILLLLFMLKVERNITDVSNNIANCKVKLPYFISWPTRTHTFSHQTLAPLTFKTPQRHMSITTISPRPKSSHINKNQIILECAVSSSVNLTLATRVYYNQSGLGWHSMIGHLVCLNWTSMFWPLFDQYSFSARYLYKANIINHKGFFVVVFLLFLLEFYAAQYHIFLNMYLVCGFPLVTIQEHEIFTISQQIKDCFRLNF